MIFGPSDIVVILLSAECFHPESQEIIHLGDSDDFRECLNSPLPMAYEDSYYTAFFSAIGGQAPYVYSVKGSFPPGLEMNARTGFICGRPSAPGDYSFFVEAKDASAEVGHHAYRICVAKSSVNSLRQEDWEDAAKVS
jgi:hypothetical protein